MLNWLKANGKAVNTGKLKDPRWVKFEELLELIEIYKRKNQYEHLKKNEIFLNSYMMDVSDVWCHQRIRLRWIILT